MDGVDDFLMISGIYHFAVCKRRWALIHIEQLWDDNEYTISGELMHTRAHNAFLTEKRGDIITTRDMPIFSRSMGVYGKCDVVEFRRDRGGVSLFGREGLWSPCPIEYKRGKPTKKDEGRLQLCAQAMCLEEMLLCAPIQTAYLYYGETKRREPVPLETGLRDKVRAMFAEMRGYYNRRHTPRVKMKGFCANCSMKDVCLPKLPSANSVSAYIKNAVADGDAL
jgi:CRISPR-associated exonuclease Cas4